MLAMLVGGATFAWFTDSKTIGKNSISTGTVYITAVRDDGDTYPGPLFYTTPEEGRTPSGVNGVRPTGLWRPGDSHERTLVLFNQSSMKVRVTRVSAAIESGLAPDTDAYNEFINKLNVKIYKNSSTVLYNGPLAGLLGSGSAAGGGITMEPLNIMYPSASIVSLIYQCSLDTSAGNALQGAQPKISFSVTVQQDA